MAEDNVDKPNSIQQASGSGDGNIELSNSAAAHVSIEEADVEVDVVGERSQWPYGPRTHGSFAQIQPDKDLDTPLPDKEKESWRWPCPWPATPLESVGILFALAIAAYAGALVRVYTKKLNQWDGWTYFPSFYSEVIGTMIMGFTIEHKKLLEQNHKIVYQAITTGFCGSVTTFSSWMNEMVVLLLQIDTETLQPVDNVTQWVGWFTILIIALGMPAAALEFGRHLARMSPWSDKRLVEMEARLRVVKGREPPELQPIAQKWIVLEVVISIVAWVIITFLIVFLTAYYKRYDLLMTCLFGWVGCYIRWLLSPLNRTFKHFRLGTFIANVAGTYILGGVRVAQELDSRGDIDITPLTEDVFAGIGDGLCGCLTTVSSFALELYTLSLGGTYIYGTVSILFSQVGLIAIRGPFQWS